MSTKSERRDAREVVEAFHEASLAELVEHVCEAVDRFRAGELDAFEFDEVMFQYSRAAKELWKFCKASDVLFTATLVRDRPPGRLVGAWCTETTALVNLARRSGGSVRGGC